MPSALATEDRFADLDFPDTEATRAGAVVRGSRVLVGGILAVAAATSAGLASHSATSGPSGSLRRHAGYHRRADPADPSAGTWRWGSEGFAGGCRRILAG